MDTLGTKQRAARPCSPGTTQTKSSSPSSCLSFGRMRAQTVKVDVSKPFSAAVSLASTKSEGALLSGHSLRALLTKASNSDDRSATVLLPRPPNALPEPGLELPEPGLEGGLGGDEGAPSGPYFRSKFEYNSLYLPFHLAIILSFTNLAFEGAFV